MIPSTVNYLSPEKSTPPVCVYLNEPEGDMLKQRTVHSFISSSPRQNGHHFADDIFKCLFVNEKSCIFIQISLKFFAKALIDNKANIGSGTGLAPFRRQAIIWTKYALICWRIYASFGLNEFKHIGTWTKLSPFYRRYYLVHFF